MHHKPTTEYGHHVTWGDHLRLIVEKGGGLKRHVARIQAEAGPIPIGSRNTFAKLFALTCPPTNSTDRFRAWALLISLDVDPEPWALGDVEMPHALNVEALKAGLDPKDQRDSGRAA